MRLGHPAAGGAVALALFLTSKVRLHCDLAIRGVCPLQALTLFLTSKVRLHCDCGVVAQS